LVLMGAPAVGALVFPGAVPAVGVPLLGVVVSRTHPLKAMAERDRAQKARRPSTFFMTISPVSVYFSA
jgi:hypothetical protein